MRQWYRINAKANDGATAELEIFGDIGASFWDDNAVSAKQFLDDLKALPSSVTTILVRVNSFGGDVFDGIAIANALRDQVTSKGRTVETVVEGIAASIASVVIMAGSKIRIADNALVMVHNPYTIGIGNAAEFRSLAETLDKIRDQIVATYKWHSKLSDEELLALIDGPDGTGTWMTADEAIANGFGTDKIEGLKAAACIDPKAAAKAKIPAQFRDHVDALIIPAGDIMPPAPIAASAADVLRLCREAELMDSAEGLITAGATLDQVNARIAEEKGTRAAAKARSTEITALCAGAHLPELAEGYIAGGMPLDTIKSQLTVLKAKLHDVTIDGSLHPAAGQGTGSWKNAFATVNSGRQTKH